VTDRRPPNARRRLGWPLVAFVGTWLPGTVALAVRHGRRMDFSGRLDRGWEPIVDAATTTGAVMLAPAFFVAVTVFVVQAWLAERATTAGHAPPR
jgi:hypothetical protein